MPEFSYPVPSLPLPIPAQADVWELPVTAAAPHLALWAQWLSPEEQQRAARFYRAADRDRFILSRGGLRALLGRYHQCPPQHLRFTYGAYGKPALAAGGSLQFNLAHSEDWILYAMAQQRVIGVDVEQIKDRSHLEGLIERCLTPEEQKHLPPATGDRLTAFLRHWTVKEAHLKAMGQGLSYAMNQVEIRWQPTLAMVRPARWDGQRFRGWTLHCWQPSPGTWAALCLEGAGGAITRRPFPLPDGELLRYGH